MWKVDDGIPPVHNVQVVDLNSVVAGILVHDLPGFEPEYIYVAYQ